MSAAGSRYLGVLCKRGHDAGGGSLRSRGGSCVECMRMANASWRALHPTAGAESARRYRTRHRERAIAKGIKWNKANRAKTRESERQRYKANPRYFKEKNARCFKKHPELKIYHNLLRRERLRNAVPKWANKFFIREAYDIAQRRTRLFGSPWHVDHIVPLKSKVVCGLHVHNNLRVIPAKVNMEKKNLYWPDMP